MTDSGQSYPITSNCDRPVLLHSSQTQWQCSDKTEVVWKGIEYHVDIDAAGHGPADALAR